LSTTNARPLRLAEVIFLTHVFDQFRDMAEKARAAGKSRHRVYPALEVKNTPLVHVLVTFDFSKTKKRLLQEIDRWLQLSKNKSRFKKHKPKTESGTAKQAKDRLKDLAAWRLYRELGCNKALEFAEENRMRDKF